MMELDSAVLRRIVAAALEEDLGRAGDLTTDTLFPKRGGGWATWWPAELWCWPGFPWPARSFTPSIRR
jgi:nicotinate-nucleotide pyrophosphorylase